ncbi:hypothetical protein KAURM247S_08251 [Kitasatospora aureofaciens]
MTYAGWPGWIATAGSVARQSATRAAVSGSSTTSHPAEPVVGRRSRVRASVTTRSGRASSNMYPIRAAGYSGSIGRYAAPVFSTARIATTSSAERGSATATRRSGPAPRAISAFASRFVRASNSAYVSEASGPTTARACGIARTWARNSSGKLSVKAWAAGPVPSAVSSARSSAVSRPNRLSRRRGSATAARSSRSHRPIMVSTVAGSYRSPVYSTDPSIPSGEPSSPSRSDMVKIRSSLAVVEVDGTSSTRSPGGAKSAGARSATPA